VIECALVDIRNLGHYNGVYGYDLGDQLLKRLVALLQTEVVGPDEGVFLAHLGDDRFLVTAPAGRLESRLRQVIHRFDASLVTVSGDGGGPANAITGAETDRLESLATTFVRRPGGVSLRAVLVRDAFESVASPRDLYRMWDVLRRRLDAEEAAVPTGPGLLVVDQVQVIEARRSA